MASASAPSCAQMQMQVLWDVQTSPAEILMNDR
jgi:hypothetical protein